MYGQQQSKFTRLSKAIAALLVVLFVVQYFVPTTREYLALVPGRTLPCVWNLVTAGFLSTSIFKLLLEVPALLFLARVIEPVYGSKEFLKFIFLVDLSICSCVFVIVYITYAITYSGTILYMQFCGFHGIIMALLVALKQIMPDHEVKMVGSVKTSTKYLPLAAVLLVCASSLLTHSLVDPLFCLLGAYSAWLYLRFFQQQGDTGLTGDASEAFRFATFFPAVMEWPVDKLASACSVVFRLGHKQSSDVKPMINMSAASVLGSDASDANRRRERGAKALEERLGLKKQQGDEESQPIVASDEAV